MIELVLLKELSLIRQVNQNTEKFFTIGVFLKKDLSFNQISAMDAMIH